MKKYIAHTLLVITSFVLTSCGGGESSTPKNDPPSEVTLQAPTNNQLCIDNRINFDWTDATDVNNDKVSYKIIFASDRGMSNVVSTKTASASNLTITLDKSKAYYWTVTAVDSKGAEGSVSAVFAFYTKGEGVVNAAPFSAKIEAPVNGDDTVEAGQVQLRWKGADPNSGDVNSLKYDVYFGENSSPAVLEENYATQNKEVTVEAGKTYYWKINTIDSSGAKSIGQVWSFTVK